MDRQEKLLDDYFDSAESSGKGLPTAQYLADNLNLSLTSLSSLLRSLTGQSTQQHIHEKLSTRLVKQHISVKTANYSEMGHMDTQIPAFIQGVQWMLGN